MPADAKQPLITVAKAADMAVVGGIAGLGASVSDVLASRLLSGKARMAHIPLVAAAAAASSVGGVLASVQLQQSQAAAAVSAGKPVPVVPGKTQQKYASVAAAVSSASLVAVALYVLQQRSGSLSVYVRGLLVALVAAAGALLGSQLEPVLYAKYQASGSK